MATRGGAKKETAERREMDFVELAATTPELVQELNQLIGKKWGSILVPEDYLASALQKSLLRNGENVTAAAAYQGVRDVIGQLVQLANDIQKTGFVDELTAVLKGKDGSGEETRQNPFPNPQ